MVSSALTTLKKLFFPTRPVVIVLVGASSAGKSSSARLLIDRFYPEKIFMMTGIDQVFFALGSATKIICKKEWIHGLVNFIYSHDATGNPIVDLSMGSLGAAIWSIVYKSSFASLSAGVNLIVDEVLLNDTIFTQLLALGDKVDMYIISVTATLEEREHRERKRKNRFIGHTRSQEIRAYQYLGHDIRQNNLSDIVIDSTHKTPEQIVEHIYEYVATHKPRAIQALSTLKPTADVAHTANAQEVARVKEHPHHKDPRPIMYILYGASSAGKTTISHELADRWYPEKIFMTIGVDDMYRGLGDETKPLRRDYHVPGEINYYKHADAQGNPVVEVDLGNLGVNLMKSQYDKAKMYLDAGFNVIFDDVIADDRVLDHVFESFDNYRICVVAVYAPLAIREQRERERGDRPLGLTRGQEIRAYTYRTKHLIKDDLCDFVVDTSTMDLPSICQQLKTFEFE